MHAGAYRVLLALAHHQPVRAEGDVSAIDSLARRSATAVSVIVQVLRDYETWFERDDKGALKCSKVGMAALGYELAARTAPVNASSYEEPLAKWNAIAATRPAAKQELDQLYALPQSVLARALWLVEAGEHQRAIAFLGDDDLTSVMLALTMPVQRPVTVFDVDTDILHVIKTAATKHDLALTSVQHDLSEPWETRSKQKFGCVFTDPPYSDEGFALFVSRAIELLKPDGTLYVNYGYSERASERALRKQTILNDMGLLLEHAIPRFSHYAGAESIGAQSSLWVCTRTPKTKPLLTGAHDGTSLYTRRAPQT